ncbi:hypothetical protein EVAR_91574_1 [Eumeta japonica]|uniref:Uncharacterized protein n=1 Tax=Eumeta variegata TaxID=151549 RepID=A0A4C1XBD6_EUMVA|nr:hypothetical protein EVAR_91574_1 [Eumeta japonica]
MSFTVDQASLCLCVQIKLLVQARLFRQSQQPITAPIPHPANVERLNSNPLSRDKNITKGEALTLPANSSPDSENAVCKDTLRYSECIWKADNKIDDI